MTLEQYRRAHGLTQQQFALRVGTRQATISRLEAGTMTPGLNLAAAIERATDGAVPAISWVEPASGSDAA